MRWQKTARAAIAIFVIGFAALVFLAMRDRIAVPVISGPVPTKDPDAVSTIGRGKIENVRGGKVDFSLAFESQSSYKDQRSKFFGITLTLPDRDGRTITVTADEAEMTALPDSQTDLKNAKLTKNVKLTTDNGIVVSSAEATYNGSDGVLRIPGPVEFARGRMTGRGLGATYDKNRDVLWLLKQAQVTVTPDAAGAGAAEGTADTAGFARADDYVRLNGNAHVVSNGRTIDANEITGLLSEDGQTIQQLQLRGHSRITGTGPGAQSMTAKDIDLMYAPDGRTLQTARLMEDATVDLPGTAGAAGRRIAGRQIDLTMAPDGATLTNLNASERVQVDLPAEGDIPVKQIRSATLKAVGAPGQGLQNAVFEGGVDYSESRAASGKLPAIARKARSQRLIVDTKPGLGAIERADFRGNVWFGDGQVTAEAPRALYFIDRDQVELSQSDGDRGNGPIVVDRQLTVQALRIAFSPSTRRLKADTDVRSVIQPQKRDAQSSSSQTHLPAMLKQDRPVNVTSNRLDYDGVSEATYSGSALLWQDKSRIWADTLVLNDRTGNLTARINVRTTMMLEDTDPKTKERRATESRATADQMVYTDAKRLAVYTATGKTPATMKGSRGDLVGDRIDLYLTESGGGLDRAEADGRVEVKDDRLHATGLHLVYTAATDVYVLTGEPVVVIQKDEQNECKKTIGTILTYQRSIGSIRVEGIGGQAATKSEPIPCPVERRE
jgi:lipopolysaccharide export system protein LptA